MALYYAPLNNVPLDKAVAIGRSIGGLAAGSMGELAGGALGAKVAVDQYDQSGRFNLAVASDTSQQMSFAGMNCQYLPVLFEQNSDAEPTLVIVKPYSQPGEDASSRIAANETPVSSPDIVNAERLCVPEPIQTVQTPSGTVNTAPAYQTQTIDNTAAKAQFSGMLEGAYQYASGIAAEAGVAADYQAAVAPVMSQGRAAISAIPNQQTITLPSDPSQGCEYSSEIMDQIGRTFAEQGPCSAGLQLEILKKQNSNK